MKKWNDIDITGTYHKNLECKMTGCAEAQWDHFLNGGYYLPSITIPVTIRTNYILFQMVLKPSPQ